MFTSSTMHNVFPLLEHSAGGKDAPECICTWGWLLRIMVRCSTPILLLGKYKQQQHQQQMYFVQGQKVANIPEVQCYSGYKIRFSWDRRRYRNWR